MIEECLVKPPTGKCVGLMTVSYKGRVDWGLDKDSDKTHGMRVYAYPDGNGGTRHGLYHKDGKRPFWWGRKHERACRNAMSDFQIQLEIQNKRNAFLQGSAPIVR